MASLDRCIIEKCKESWDEEFLPGTKNANNCSGFVKAVARKLGIPLDATLNADGISDAVAASWEKIDSGEAAAKKAATGYFVLAVLKSSDHRPARANGHVAVVVDGPLYRGKYPLVWGGSIGSAQSQGSKSVGEVWNRSDRDSVQYYSYSSLSCRQ